MTPFKPITPIEEAAYLRRQAYDLARELLAQDMTEAELWQWVEREGGTELRQALEARADETLAFYLEQGGLCVIRPMVLHMVLSGEDLRLRLLAYDALATIVQRQIAEKVLSDLSLLDALRTGILMQKAEWYACVYRN